MKRIFCLCLFALFTCNAQAKTKWFTESPSEDWTQKIVVEEKIFQKKTPLHRVKILQTSRFGKMLIVDGALESTEKDAFISHEMLAHVPLLAHGNAKRVLIIGGKDGGILHEVLRHPSLQEVICLQDDKTLFEKCKKYFESTSQGAFEDPRVRVILESTPNYLKNTKDTFDIIICDSGFLNEESLLLSKEFYSACQKVLHPQGLLVLKNGTPFLQGKEIAKAQQNQNAFFKESSLFVASIPSSRGLTAFSLCTNDTSLKEISVERIAERRQSVSGKMRYYTPAIHKAAFELPPYIYELVSELPTND